MKLTNSLQVVYRCGQTSQYLWLQQHKQNVCQKLKFYTDFYIMHTLFFLHTFTFVTDCEVQQQMRIIIIIFEDMHMHKASMQ